MARSYHHGALAEAMVEQALLDVRHRGADHVSLRGIAQSLDVSPSAAYNHFADKEDLLRSVRTCGFAALDERMARALAAHRGSTPESAVARFRALGRAYVLFAIDERHLFDLTFSPSRGEIPEDAHSTGPYQKLTAALDELERMGLLREGIRPGLDVTIWASTHGMATLIVEGALPAEGLEPFLESVAALILA